MNYKYPVIIGSLFVVLLLATQIPVTGAQNSSYNVSPANWDSPMGVAAYNYDYNSQTQVGPNNVNNLQIKWIFALPPAPTNIGLGNNGVGITPLVVGGIAYFITNYHLIYALNTKDGSVVWQRELPVLTYQGLVSSIAGGGNSSGHYHAIWYTPSVRGQPLIWVDSDNYTVFALNALTGDINLSFSYIPPGLSIPGNEGLYDTTTPFMIVDNTNGILVTGASVSETITAGRGWLAGYDITQTPPKLLWRSFLMTPQDGSDPAWDIQAINNMTGAYIWNGTATINLKSLSPAELNSTLYGDWGTTLPQPDGYNGTYALGGGTGVGWGGSWAVDPASATAYVATGEAAPDQNATFRPGPDLWSDSILSVNEHTGAINWAYQTTSHDVWDYDCSWGVILANETINGAPGHVVYKGCKNGDFYALNAATGAPLWVFNPPNIVRCSVCNLFDFRNQTQMDLKWDNYPSLATPDTNCANTGCIESSPAYDPTTNTVFVMVHNNPTYVDNTPLIGYNGGHHGATTPGGTNNMTLWALNGATGAVVWSHFFAGMAYRGGLTVSNGVVYVAAPDGNLYFMNEKDGSVIGAKFIGTGLGTEPALAQDAQGNTVLVEPADTATGTYYESAPTVPGFIFALSLPNASSVASGSSTGSGPAQTTTVTAPGGATTVTLTTATGATTSGFSSTAFYGVVGVAIILLITTVVFAMRRRPATAASPTTETKT